ncbi:hypothetical protein OsI_30506 [Oryza sativa Indica Group]|uniref:Uncharacterized protein n=2 Tax=Oryza TaxID=4527 RepID=B8BD76_ORYSI|nr:hypothetical protein OsI_30506 [Oryza sativa Indica Group]
MGSLAEIGGHLKLSCLLLQRQVEDDSNLGAVTLLFQASPDCVQRNNESISLQIKKKVSKLDVPTGVVCVAAAPRSRSAKHLLSGCKLKQLNMKSIKEKKSFEMMSRNIIICLL